MNEIYIDDVIGEDFFGEGITNRNIKAMLDEMDGDVKVFISTPGGSVFEGQDIYNTFKDYDRGSVQMVIGSIAASIGSVIMFAGDGLPMVRNNSSIMIHDPSAGVMGTAQDMRQTAEALDSVKENIINVYRESVTDQAVNFSDLMSAETWFTAQQAIDMGLAIPYEKSGPMNQSAMHGMSYEKLMQEFTNNKKQAEPVEEEPEQIEEIKPETPNLEARKRFLEILSDDS